MIDLIYYSINDVLNNNNYGHSFELFLRRNTFWSNGMYKNFKLIKKILKKLKLKNDFNEFFTNWNE